MQAALSIAAAQDRVSLPEGAAAKIAVSTVYSWLSQHPGAIERVIFNVFKDEDKKYYEELIR